MCNCNRQNCGRRATFATATVLDGRLASITAFEALCGRCHQIDHRAAVPGTFFFTRVDAIYDLEEVECDNREVISGRRNRRGDLCSIDGCTNRPGVYELHGQRGKYRLCNECAIAAMVVALDNDNLWMLPHLIEAARRERGPELLRTGSDANIAHRAKAATAPAPVGKDGQLIVPLQTGAKQGQLKVRAPKKAEPEQHSKPASPRKRSPTKAAKHANTAPRMPDPIVTAKPVATPTNVTSNPAQTIVFGARFLPLVTEHRFDPFLFEKARAAAYAKAPDGSVLEEVFKLPGGPEAVARMRAAERDKRRRMQQPEQPAV